MEFRSKNIFAIVMLPCVLLLMYAPLDIYFSQYDWFWFNIKELLPYLIIILAVGTGMAFLFTLLIAKQTKLAMWLCTVIFGFTLAVYIQGTYLRTNFGIMNGEQIVWSDYRTDFFVSVAVFAVVMAGSLLVMVKFREKALKCFNIVSLCLMVVLLFTLSVSFIQNKTWIPKERLVSTNKGKFDFSKKRNIIILIMDSLDARYINDVLDTTDYGKILDGFDYYDNASPMYNGTDYSVPQILTGMEYINDRKYGDYLEEAYKTSWIKSCKNSGWEVNGYLADIYMTRDVTDGLFDNYEMRTIGVSSHKRLLQYMYKFVGFRYSPVPLKKIFWFYPDEMTDLENMEGIFTWNNKQFYDDLCSNKINLKYDNPALNLYYIRGLHTPINFDENFNGVSNTAEAPWGATVAMFKIIEQMCSRLKEADIYDNTAIVILGDHGASDDNELKSSPALLVKDFDKHGKVVATDRVLEYKDVPKMFKNLSEGRLYSAGINFEPRERKLYRIWWAHALNSESGGGVLKEYIIPKDSKDIESIYTLEKTIDVYTQE